MGKNKLEINMNDLDQQLIMAGIANMMDKHDKHEVLDLVKRISQEVFMALLAEKRGD